MLRDTQRAGPGDLEDRDERFTLRLLGGFDLRLGDQIVALPLNVRRMLALLSVRCRPIPRLVVAETLWMDSSHERAVANLRSTLWRLGSQRDRLIICAGSGMGLADGVDVDLVRVVRHAKLLIGSDSDVALDIDADELGAELLPELDEEWLHDEREQLRQLRMHALDALCSRLRQGGRSAEAVCIGQAAVTTEPLRESAQVLLIRAHLAEGNIGEANRQFEIYRQLLWRSLQVTPSPRMISLITDALTT